MDYLHFLTMSTNIVNQLYEIKGKYSNNINDESAKLNNIVDYCSEIASTMFNDIYRENGLPYTQEHLMGVAETIDDLILDPYYKAVAKAAAYLHDSGEDLEYIKVFNPYSNTKTYKINRDDSNAVELNELLKDFSNPIKSYSLQKKQKNICDDICYIVNRLTCPGGKYQNYIDEINDINYGIDELNPDNMNIDSEHIKILNICSAILKTADTDNNTSPSEAKNIDSTIDEYLSIVNLKAKTKDEREKKNYKLKNFLKKTKTYNSFVKKYKCNVLKSNDPMLLSSSLHKYFRLKQRARSLDNVLIYTPLFDEKITPEIQKNKSIFNLDSYKKLLFSLYINSFDILTDYKIFDLRLPDYIDSKKINFQNNTPILEEVLKYSGKDGKTARHLMREISGPNIRKKHEDIKNVFKQLDFEWNKTTINLAIIELENLLKNINSFNETNLNIIFDEYLKLIDRLKPKAIEFYKEYKQNTDEVIPKKNFITNLINSNLDDKLNSPTYLDVYQKTKQEIKNDLESFFKEKRVLEDYLDDWNISKINFTRAIKDRSNMEKVAWSLATVYEFAPLANEKLLGNNNIQKQDNLSRKQIKQIKKLLQSLYVTSLSNFKDPRISDPISIKKGGYNKGKSKNLSDKDNVLEKLINYRIPDRIKINSFLTKYGSLSTSNSFWDKIVKMIYRTNNFV
jgi:hypothetical protein